MHNLDQNSIKKHLIEKPFELNALVNYQMKMGNKNDKKINIIYRIDLIH